VSAAVPTPSGFPAEAAVAEPPKAPPLFAALHAAAAALRWKLDDQLGRFHGIGLDDLMLLYALSNRRGDGGAAIPLKQLAAVLWQTPAATLRRVAALEKIGLVDRTTDAAGRRCIALRPAGAGVLRLGVESAEDRGAQAQSPWPAEARASLCHALQALAASPAWRVD